MMLSTEWAEAELLPVNTEVVFVVWHCHLWMGVGESKGKLPCSWELDSLYGVSKRSESGLQLFVQTTVFSVFYVFCWDFRSVICWGHQGISVAIPWLQGGLGGLPLGVVGVEYVLATAKVPVFSFLASLQKTWQAVWFAVCGPPQFAHVGGWFRGRRQSLAKCSSPQRIDLCGR